MNENNYNQAAPQPEKKRVGSNWVWIILLSLGLILFIIGAFLFNSSDWDKFYKTKNFSQSYSADNVSKLKIDIPWAELTISKSNDDKIYIDATNVPESFSAEVNGRTFSTGYRFTKFGINLPNKSGVIEIKIPEKDYDSFILDLGAGKSDISDIKCGFLKIDCGAGGFYANNIDCTSADIDCGAGELDFRRINCEREFNIDGGAGKITISDAVLGGIDVDQGVGEFVFNGTVNGDIEGDGGVGEMTFNLTNPETDFSRHGGRYKLDIDTGVGDVDITFNN